MISRLKRQTKKRHTPSNKRWKRIARRAGRAALADARVFRLFYRLSEPIIDALASYIPPE